MPRYVEERSEQAIVQFLSKLLDQRIPAVRCEYSAQAPCGFSYPLVEEAFELPSEEAIEMLEELVTEGLLDRRLANKVHLCPGCGWHTLNFVEVCPRCRAIDVDVENVIHHFSCAYVGPWSEFRQGVDLVCPKCDEQLRHMGLDYEKPSDTYVCRDCGYVFTDSAVEVQCLRCGQSAEVEEVPPTRIYEYIPNPKTSRAVEYGRITGLDIQSVLFEDRSRTFRQDFLIFEIDREIYRARRYDSALSLVLLDIEGLQDAEGVEDKVDLRRTRREIFDQMSDTLRDLDVVSAVNETRAAVLLPETALEAAVTVAQRLQAIICEFQSVNAGASVTVTAAVAGLLAAHESGKAFLDYVQEAFQWARENRPGTVVSAETWEKEAHHE